MLMQALLGYTRALHAYPLCSISSQAEYGSSCGGHAKVSMPEPENTSGKIDSRVLVLQWVHAIISEMLNCLHLRLPLSLPRNSPISSIDGIPTAHPRLRYDVWDWLVLNHIPTCLTTTPSKPCEYNSGGRCELVWAWALCTGGNCITYNTLSLNVCRLQGD